MDLGPADVAVLHCDVRQGPSTGGCTPDVTVLKVHALAVVGLDAGKQGGCCKLGLVLGV